MSRKNVSLSPRLELIKQLHNWGIVLLPSLAFIYSILLSIYGGSPQLLDWLVLGGMWIVSGLGITVGFHRLLAHRSFTALPIVKTTLAIMGSMAVQGPPIIWVSIHRKHHEHSDQPEDPHSPFCEMTSPSKLRGLWHAHIGWMFTYQNPNPGYYAIDLVSDQDILWVNRTYLFWVALGLVIPAIIEFLITQSWLGFFKGFLWGGLVRLFLVQNVIWSINSFCHLLGTRQFKTNNNSANIGLLAIPSLGESWHNNHHAFPHSAQFGLRWWQIDIGYSLIKLLKCFGWVSAIKSPSISLIRAKQA